MRPGEPPRLARGSMSARTVDVGEFVPAWWKLTGRVKVGERKVGDSISIYTVVRPLQRGATGGNEVY